jgi:replicative DNA helicase
MRKDKKNQVDTSTLIYGKVPPQAKDLEDAILGAIMLEKDAFDRVSEILTPVCFYVASNQLVYETMCSLAIKKSPIDILTVIEEMRALDHLETVGGPYYVTKLTNAVVSSANIEAHAEIIRDKYQKRELIRISAETISEAYEDSGPAEDMISDAEQKLSLLNNAAGSDVTPLDTEMVNTYQELLIEATGGLTGVPSGFRSLDAITHGWQETDLIILAARPAVGKTALALNLARNAAKNQMKPTKVLFFSLEMSKGQLTRRIMSAESGVFLEKIATRTVNEYDKQVLFEKGVQGLKGQMIFLDDTPALNIFQMRAKARKIKRKHDIGLIIVDYLQLMSGVEKRGNREQEISTISRGLKGLAKELKLPIIALSQLSRDVEKRKDGNKMPQLSDLRESGAIEQDADMVMFLYRPEYYDITEDQMGDNNRGETHVRIAKHRNGSLDTIKLMAKLEIQKFFESDGITPFPTNLPPSFRRIEKHEDEITF